MRNKKAIFTIMLFSIFLTLWNFNYISILSLGGLFLLCGAYYIAIGDIQMSTISYLFADTCWVISSYKHDDYFGSFLISIGMLSGIIVMYYMQKGIFVKNLRKKV
jgi:hypothetical protein